MIHSLILSVQFIQRLEMMLRQDTVLLHFVHLQYQWHLVLYPVVSLHYLYRVRCGLSTKKKQQRNRVIAAAIAIIMIVAMLASTAVTMFI